MRNLRPILVVVGLLACVSDEVTPSTNTGSSSSGSGGNSSSGNSGSSGASGNASSGGASSSGGSSSGSEPDAGPPSPPLMTPAVWLDAHVAASIKNTRWEDQSGNLAHANGTAAITLAPQVLGLHPGIVMGDGKELKIANANVALDAAKGFTFFVVAKARPGGARSGTMRLFERKGGPERNGIALAWTTINNRFVAELALTSPTALTNVFSSDYSPSPSSFAELPHIYTFHVGGGQLTLWIDTAAGPAANINAMGITLGSSNLVDVTLGGSSPTLAGNGFDGYIGELAIYTRELSATDLTTAINALKREWAIP